MSNWITPVTDRNSGARHTLPDQNRIAGNLDWLATETRSRQLYNGPAVTKSAYTYNDYMDVTYWPNLLEVLSALITALNLTTEGVATDAMTYDNMNTVESLTLAVYNKYQLLLSQANNNHFAGDGGYSANDTSAIYAGGLIL